MFYWQQITHILIIFHAYVFESKTYFAILSIRNWRDFYHYLLQWCRVNITDFSLCITQIGTPNNPDDNTAVIAGVVVAVVLAIVVAVFIIVFKR